MLDTYVAPYYLLLNRPKGAASGLRIHKHTIPACIPLAILAARYLPQTISPDDETYKGNRAQRLPQLVRELRRELMAYHSRSDSISALQEGVNPRDGEGRYGIVEVASEGADARDIRMEWEDGRIARVRMAKDRVITKAVVFDESGRRRDIERRLMSEPRGVEFLMTKIREIEAL